MTPDCPHANELPCDCGCTWCTLIEDECLSLETFTASLPAERIAIENPSGAIGTAIRKADQWIQPWQYGDPFRKRTGLWLKGLSKLTPEVTVKPIDVTPWRQAGYGPKRSETGTRKPGGIARKVSERNKTFPGIARAMADQWG